VALFVALHSAGVSYADLSGPGPWNAGWAEVSVARPGGSTFTAVLFYPAQTSGEGALFDDSGAPYPAVSFGHGYLQPVEQYESTLQHLATWGYFAIASRSAGGLFPSHGAFAEDLRHCLTYLEDVNGDPASPFFGGVDTAAFALSGHSMGGGASILAAAADPRASVVVNLAAADTNPSAIAAMPVDMPTFLIAGSEDAIVPVADHGQPMYDAALPPKQLPLITGGFHCGFTDDDFLFCDSGSISRAEQLAITRRLMTTVLELYLRGEQALWRQLWGPAALADPAVSYQANAGVTVVPATPVVEAPVLETVEVTLSVTNTGADTVEYRLFVEDLTWDATVTPGTTGPLAPGAAASVTLAVIAPGGAPGAAQTALISARNELDGATRGYATVSLTRVPGAGDLNCDGVIDGFDVDPFVLAIADPAGYAAAYPDCDRQLADVNADGAVDGFDIDPFVLRLVGGG
jgi:dienelactone hydrolase